MQVVKISDQKNLTTFTEAFGAIVEININNEASQTYRYTSPKPRRWLFNCTSFTFPSPPHVRKPCGTTWMSVTAACENLSEKYQCVKIVLDALSTYLFNFFLEILYQIVI